MKYNIEIMSKDQCTLFSTKDLTEDYIIISINDIGHKTVIYDNEHIINVYSLWFDDIEPEWNIPNNEDNLQEMIKEQAEIIKVVVDIYKDKVNNIIVHCTAGISRSGAVGCALARYLNGDDKYLLKTGQYMPNRHVYKLMCEALDLEYSDELFKEKLRICRKGLKDSLKGYGDYGMNLDDIFCDVVIEEK